MLRFVGATYVLVMLASVLLLLLRWNEIFDEPAASFNLGDCDPNEPAVLSAFRVVDYRANDCEPILLVLLKLFCDSLGGELLLYCVLLPSPRSGFVRSIGGSISF